MHWQNVWRESNQRYKNKSTSKRCLLCFLSLLHSEAATVEKQAISTNKGNYWKWTAIINPVESKPLTHSLSHWTPSLSVMFESKWSWNFMKWWVIWEWFRLTPVAFMTNAGLLLSWKTWKYKGILVIWLPGLEGNINQNLKLWKSMFNINCSSYAQL